MAVRIRMKKMGKRHRPFYRVCATDARTPRDGRVLEELGTYDPMVADTDARAVLNGERIDYWLGVGAQPSETVQRLIKFFDANGSNTAQPKREAAQKAAADNKPAPKPAPKPVAVAPAPAPKAEEAEAEAASAEAEHGSSEVVAVDAPAAEAPAGEADKA